MKMKYLNGLKNETKKFTKDFNTAPIIEENINNETKPEEEQEHSIILIQNIAKNFFILYSFIKFHNLKYLQKIFSKFHCYGSVRCEKP